MTNKELQDKVDKLGRRTARSEYEDIVICILLAIHEKTDQIHKVVNKEKSNV